MIDASAGEETVATCQDGGMGVATHSVPEPRVDRFADGTVKARGFLLNGELHGCWEWFRQDGSLMREGEFEHGAQTGVWRTWDRSGGLVSEKILTGTNLTGTTLPDGTE